MTQHDPAADPTIHHDSGVHRFATTVEGAKAYLDYRLEEGTMTITHTWVPDEIGGRGIAGKLVKAAFEHARSTGLRVHPDCSYAAAWAQRHPEYVSLLV
jgi:hypothetical protein